MNDNYKVLCIDQKTGEPRSFLPTTYSFEEACSKVEEMMESWSESANSRYLPVPASRTLAECHALMFPKVRTFKYGKKIKQ